MECLAHCNRMIIIDINIYDIYIYIYIFIYLFIYMLTSIVCIRN